MYDKRVVGKTIFATVCAVALIGAIVLLIRGDARISEIPEEDGREAFELAHRWRKLEPDVQTHVNASFVYFRFSADTVVEAPLPSDSMVIAAAPYINYTHPCAIHAISSCQGGLPNEPVEVTVTDQEGRTVNEKETTTRDNGFVELWLPRDREYTLRFEARGRSAETTAGTYSDSPTCLTNLRLEHIDDENGEETDA